MKRVPVTVAVLAAAWLGSGCLSEAAMQDRVGFSEGVDNSSSTPPPAFADTSSGVRVNVFPAVTPDEEGTLPLLPQTFEFAEVTGYEMDLGTLRLDPAEVLRGEVIGFRHNPLIANVPGREVTVNGAVFLERAGTVENYRLSTDPKSGVYEVQVLRPAVYDLTVVPDDPLLPMFTTVLELNTQPAPLPPGAAEGDLDIGLGVPVYGQVTAAGVPVANARVYVEDDQGHRSVTTRTDEQGRYLIRVAPEVAYTVVCEGARSLHPVWRRRRVAQPSRGVAVDFPYPTQLDPLGVATGEVVSGVDGASVDGTRIRFVSDSLIGYDELLQAGDEVSWSWEEVLDSRGIVTVRVAPGTYRVELIPPTSERSVETPDPGLVFSPVWAARASLPGQIWDGGEVVLPATDFVGGVVADADGAPLPGATIRCEEQGFGSRAVSAVTDEIGGYELELPRVPLTCAVVPPQNDRGRSQLAVRTFTIASSERLPAEIQLSEGVLFRAQVLDPSLQPQPFAWVEVRDLASDALLTYGIANKGGEVWLRGELPEPATQK